MLRHLLDMYHGALNTIREHLLFDTSIARFMYETAGVPNVSFKVNGSYLPQTKEYDGYIGDLADRELLPIVVGGTAEMLAKIMLIRELGLEEKKVYECASIKEAVTELTSFVNKLSIRDVGTLVSQIGQENLRFLHDRLDDGYVASFDVHGDNMLTRALLLFQLMSFYKYHEFKWFSFFGCMSNENVKHEVEKLAKRMFNTFLPMAKGKKVVFFPKYGRLEKLTASADIQIGDTLMIISTLGKEQWTDDSFYRSAVILNTCATLAAYDGDTSIKNKMIYHVRWNSFTKVV